VEHSEDMYQETFEEICHKLLDSKIYGNFDEEDQRELRSNSL
jgi:hypothetical protein